MANSIDIKTGNIKWIYPTEFPTWVPPLVTNGLVFSGHVTATGKPYGISQFGGPSIGNGMLFVTTGQTFTIGANSGGGIIAFGLPK